MKIYRALLFAALIAAQAGVFVACGPSNKMKTLKQQDGSFTFVDKADGKNANADLSKEEKQAILDAQEKTENTTGDSMVVKLENNDKINPNGSFEEKADSTNANTVAPELANQNTGDSSEPTASANDTTAASSNSPTVETPQTAPVAQEDIFALSPKTQKLIKMIDDIHLSEGIVSIRYKDANNRYSTQLFAIDTKKTAEAKAGLVASLYGDTYFKANYFNGVLSADGTLDKAKYPQAIEIVPTVSTVGSSKLITIIATDSNGEKSGANAIIQEAKGQIILSADVKDEALEAAAKQTVTVIRTHFVIATQENNELTFFTGSTFNRVRVIAKDADGKKTILNMSYSAGKNTENFFTNNTIVLEKMASKDKDGKSIMIDVIIKLEEKTEWLQVKPAIHDAPAMGSTDISL